MPEFLNYDPTQVVVTFAGFELTMFASGTFVSATRDDDAFETVAGAQGDITRVYKANRAGVVTLTLQQSSPSNDVLSARHATDVAELTRGQGAGELTVKDLNGTTLIQADTAWVVRPPETTFSDGLESREWQLACADLDMRAGGSLV